MNTNSIACCALTGREAGEMAAELARRGFHVVAISGPEHPVEDEATDNAKSLAMVAEFRDQAAMTIAAVCDPRIWAIAVPADWAQDRTAKTCAAVAYSIGRPVLKMPNLDPVAIGPARTDDQVMQAEEVQRKLMAAIGIAADQAAAMIGRVDDHANAAIQDDKQIVVPAGIAASVAASLTSTLTALRAIDDTADRRPATVMQVFGLGPAQ